MSEAKPKNLTQRLIALDAHHRIMWAGVAAAAAFFIMEGRVFGATQTIATWDVCALVYLTLAWTAVIHGDPAVARRTARLQDSSRSIIFVLVVIAAVVSFLTIGFLLGPSKNLPHDDRLPHIVLSIVAVVFSWLVTHTVFAIHYAHLYYSCEDEGSTSERAGGLEFPGGEDPDYPDFIYFSFVIGMTCQVSDVQITARSLRHLATAHGVLSFGFNTIILALSINAISNLI